MLVALASLSLVLPSALTLRRGADPILQPATYHSPDGHWTLDVDPSRRDGGGPGSYSMHKDGQLAWGGARSWTLWQAIVTDGGFVAGYGYSEGIGRATGEFRMLVLSPKGEIGLDEKIARRGGSYIDGDPIPSGAGILHVPGADRVIFSIVDDNDAGELWIGYELPSCKEVFRKRPKSQLTDDGASIYRPVTRVVRGAPLFVAQWERYEFEPKHEGAHFALFDADAVLQWELVRPDDWYLDGPSGQQWRDMRAGAGLLDVDEPQHFALWAPRSHERLEFEVVPSPGGKPAWNVIDKGKKPQADPVKTASAGVSFTEVLLEERSMVQLESGADAVASPIHDVVAFAFEGPESIRFVRSDTQEGRFALVHIDTKGHVQSERNVDIEGRLDEIQIKWWPVTDHEWIVTQSPFGTGAKSLAWSVDDRSGEVQSLSSFDFPSIKDVSGSGNGRFVALGTEHTEYQMLDRFAAFDAQGVREWQVDEGYAQGEPGSLLSPASIAVTGDGSIAVVDNIQKTLQFFDSKGAFVRRIELKTAFGQDPNYPTGVHWDVDNGVLVQDFDGEPPLWRLDAAGVVRQKITPSLANGQNTHYLSLLARVAPDGKIWTMDGTRIQRLDAKGVVDLELGVPLDVDKLREPDATTIDVLGRVLIQDRKTGAVHVFGADGKRVFVAKPDPKEVGRRNMLDSISPTRGGGVTFHHGKGEFLAFGPRGESLGVRAEFPSDFMQSPLTGLGAGTRYNDGWYLYDEAGKQLQHVERRPDRRWLQHMSPPAIGPDGSIAFCEHGDAGPGVWGAVLILYGPRGEAGRMIDIPDGVPAHWVSLSTSRALIYSWKPECMIVELATGKATHFVVPGASEKSEWKWGFSADGSEVLGLETRELMLHRFALP